MSKHSPSLILHDDVLDVFLGKGCVRNKYDTGNRLGKFSGNYDVSLTGFALEEFSHRRDQVVRKAFDGLIWWKSIRIGLYCFMVDVRFRLISS